MGSVRLLWLNKPLILLFTVHLNFAENSEKEKKKKKSRSSKNGADNGRRRWRTRRRVCLAHRCRRTRCREPGAGVGSGLKKRCAMSPLLCLSLSVPAYNAVLWWGAVVKLHLLFGKCFEIPGRTTRCPFIDVPCVNLGLDTRGFVFFLSFPGFCTAAAFEFPLRMSLSCPISPALTFPPASIQSSCHSKQCYQKLPFVSFLFIKESDFFFFLSNATENRFS